MKLLQRVSALVRANINDLIDRAEDPVKMIKQLILDLNNQLIQVKTTVAQSLADQHLLDRRLEDARKAAADYERRAQLAVDKGDDTLARAALDRYNSFVRTVEETEKHLEEQKRETNDLKLALAQLETKIAEVTRNRDTLLARHRRAVAKEKLTKVKSSIHPEHLEQVLDAIDGYVVTAEARAKASAELHQDAVHRRLHKLETDSQLDEQLAAMKAKRASNPAA
ncbi:MAG: PspA/IM30 family protein [Candidatus Sumerlaeaceae bacterium]|nr:PspA/IM30 family protein [Candidatus Sumerlaeaceae bacterium]